MNMDMFIPRKIKVGFQERKDTYTGKLGYATYIDEKGELRKERSFNSWRSYQIEPEIFDNEPMSGFVLNKKAGGLVKGQPYRSRWKHRQTYIRVYDPRGFEVEISVENQLFILEHMNSIIGKGLDGELIYAWAEKELILLPVNSVEYEEIKEASEERNERKFVNANELVVGGTYFISPKETMVYLGLYDEYEYPVLKRNPHYYSHTVGVEKYQLVKKKKQQHYFAKTATGYAKTHPYDLMTYTLTSKKLFGVSDESEHPELSAMLNSLDKHITFMPIDLDKTVVEAITMKEFSLYCEREGGKHGGRWAFRVVAENGKEYLVQPPKRGEELYILGEKGGTMHGKNMYDGTVRKFESYEDVFNVLNPRITRYYQANGNLYASEFIPWVKQEKK